MGAGFAFMGRQYHIEVSEKDFYIDILMVRFVYTKTINSLMGGYRAAQAA